MIEKDIEVFWGKEIRGWGDVWIEDREEWEVEVGGCKILDILGIGEEIEDMWESEGEDM